MAQIKRKQKFFDVEIPLINKIANLRAFELKDLNGKFIKYEPLNGANIDQIEIDQQSEQVFLNENLIGKQHSVMFLPSKPSLNTFAPVTIPEGQYFMMGDNRTGSSDSRLWGPLSKDNVIGRAIFRAWPFNRINIL